jgi:hypothetical protein
MQPLTPSTVRREPKLKPKPKRQITGIYDDELLEDYPTAGSWNY